MINLKNENDLADLKDGLKHTPEIVLDFLKQYCGFMAPLNTVEPYTIAYSQGKRDVILTLLTIMRDDITPAQIRTSLSPFREVQTNRVAAPKKSETPLFPM